MRSFVIVILHPPADPFPRLFERPESRLDQELLPDRLPEALYFPERLRMMRAAPEVVHPALGQFLLKGCLAAPVGVLPPVVRQHLLRRPVGTDPAAIHFQHVVRRLAPEHFQGRDVTGMVINKPDEVGVFAPELEGEDIALPHLVGRAALEKARR